MVLTSASKAAQYKQDLLHKQLQNWRPEQALLVLKASLLGQQAVVITAITSRVLKLLPESVSFAVMTLTEDTEN